MRFKTFLSLVLLALVAGVPSPTSAAADFHNEISHHKVLTEDSDPISGEWDVSFLVQGTTTPATFKFKLEGEKLTGTAESAHTGPGTISKGSWTGNKLSFTLNFKSHESIALSGSLNDGKLSGEFSTEGFVSKWEAQRKSTRAAIIPTAPTSADPISGEWEAMFEGQGTKVPVALRFKLDGDKVTGSTDSEHLGAGTVSKGSWAKGRLAFTMGNAQMPFTVTGGLQDSKLVGEFTAGAMHGKWEARKK